MSNPLALIVDDEPDIRELLEITLSRMNIDTIAAGDLAGARTHLSAGSNLSLCLTDMRLPDGSGLELVEEIGAKHPQLPVAVITAHGNMETAVQALKAGAFDFVSKPINLDILRPLVKTALKLSTSDSAPTEVTLPAADAPRLLGNSTVIENIRILISKLARSQAPVHITGESGTGKELVARLIHSHSPRKENPFVAVNCGAIPSELMESEFFGHKKGSFTGAIADKKGLFQAADGGTLFLDEVGDLPLHMQVKLLRTIQEKSIRPIGEQQEIAINVRIVSATHKNLAQLTQEGMFRQDLFYRINVIDLEIPPLRERLDDLNELIDFLLQRVAENNGFPKPAIASAAVKKLKTHTFPGNIRELENILERATALCDDNTITTNDLLLSANSDQKLSVQIPTEMNGMNLEEFLEETERQVILQALDSTRWNRTLAAKHLGISFRALRYRLDKLGINEE